MLGARHTLLVWMADIPAGYCRILHCGTEDAKELRDDICSQVHRKAGTRSLACNPGVLMGAGVTPSQCWASLPLGWGVGPPQGAPYPQWLSLHLKDYPCPLTISVSLLGQTLWLSRICGVWYEDPTRHKHQRCQSFEWHVWHICICPAHLLMSSNSCLHC